MRYQPTTKKDIGKYSKIIKYISQIGDGPDDDEIIMPEPLAKKKRVWKQPPRSRRLQRPNVSKKVKIAKPNTSLTRPKVPSSTAKETNAAVQSPLGEMQYAERQNEVATEEQEAEVIPAINVKLERADDNLFSCPIKTCCYMTIRRHTMMEHLLHHSLRYHCSLCSNKYSFLASARLHWAKDHSESLFNAQSFVCCDTQYQKLLETVFQKRTSESS